MCAVVYGWAGATRGSVEAARTDDILAIIRAQFLCLDLGPKLIAADLNGSIDAFPTLQGMLKEQGWHDVGMADDKCEGRPGQPTCHTNEGSRETGIDYIFANSQLMQAIRKCHVDNTSGFLTHRPLTIEIVIGKLERTTKKVKHIH